MNSKVHRFCTKRWIHFLALIFLIFANSESYALSNPYYESYYECKADKAFLWQKGQLIKHPFMMRMGIHFQLTSSNKATIARGMKAPWSSTELDITQDPNASGDLIAKDTWQTFRIHIDSKSNKVTFLWSDDDSLTNGHCQLMQSGTEKKISVTQDIQKYAQMMADKTTTLPQN